MNENNIYIINSMFPLENYEVKDLSTTCHYMGTNNGNAFPPYALIKSLYGKLIKFNHLQNYDDIIHNRINKEKELERINSSSKVFFFLQDAIRPMEYDFFTVFRQDPTPLIDFLKKIKTNIIVPNIGINYYLAEFNKDFYKRLRPEMVEILKIFSEKSEFIGVRGELTKEVLYKLGIKNTHITGCPTYFENGKNRIIKKQDDIRIKDIVKNDYFNNNQYLKNNKIIIQAKDSADTVIVKIFQNDIKHLPLKQLLEYVNKDFYIMPSILDWKKILKKYKCTMGQRIHGSIMAINQGLTPIIFCKDIRAKEMLDYFRLPYFELDRLNENPLKLLEELDFSEANNTYNKLYDNYVDFLHKNNLKMYYENPDIDIKQLEEITMLPSYTGDKYYRISKLNIIKQICNNINTIRKVI